MSGQRALAMWWLAGIGVALLLVIGFAIRQGLQPAPVPYSAFLDELDAGDVASVTIHGTEIDARSKQGKTLVTLMPDFGDPALIPELRKERVTIMVASASWTSWFARIPWPLWLFGGALLFAGIRRLVQRGRGGSETPASSMPMHPMQGMLKAAAGIFKSERAADSSAPDVNERNER